MINRITTLKEVVDWIDKETSEHLSSFPDGRNVFVNGAMTALKNLKHFIDLQPTSEQTDQNVLWKDVVIKCFNDESISPWKELVEQLSKRFTISRK